MSVFQNVLVFFNEIGMYEVVLPFLLIFTIVYALLDKTRVLGVERIGDKEFPKRNINSMVAFVVGFIIVASTQLVAIISDIIANTVMLLLLIVLFMLLAGTMQRDDGQGFQVEGWYKNAFMVIMFVGIILIFLNAFGWLQALWFWLLGSWNSQFLGVIIMLLIFAGVIWWITSDPARKAARGEK
ncbi:hypothetical protein D6789_03250 [Candidatus Woesearchaeota archaeon]|nr:MAG: hypothetical protein D6789_03250 [Candidatus Woesearchaeota archaeon]